MRTVTRRANQSGTASAGVRSIEQVVRSRIAQLRKRLNLSQAGLAQAIGVSRGTVNGWESGRTSVNIDLVTLLKLARALRLRSIEELFGDLPKLDVAAEPPRLGPFPSAHVSLDRA